MLTIAGLAIDLPASAATAGPLRLRLSLQSPRALTLMDGLGPAMRKDLGLPVRVIAFRIDGAGRWPLEVVYGAPPDALEVLVTATPHLISMQAYGKSYIDVTNLTPIGRLTRGDSYVLVVPRGIGGNGLDAIRNLARHAPLLIAVPDTSGGFSLLPSLAVRRCGLQPDMLDVVSAPDALAEVSKGKAQMAVTLMHTFVARRALNPDLRILMVSGARRSPRFPDVPTVAEATGMSDLGFTSSLGLFGPPHMPARTVARINHAIAQAVLDPVAIAAAEKTGYVLDPAGPDVLAADFARDARVLKRL